MPPPHGIAEIMKKRRLGMMKPGVAEAMENERTRISNHMAEIARRKRVSVKIHPKFGTVALLAYGPLHPLRWHFEQNHMTFKYMQLPLKNVNICPSFST